MLRRPPPALVLAGLVLWAPPAAAAEPKELPRPTIYKWVDENGIAHYTTDPERIPEEIRDRLGTRVPERRPAAGAEAGAPPEAVSSAGSVDWAAQDADPDDDVVGAVGSREAGGEPADATTVAARQRSESLRSLEERISGLEAEILRDEERLKSWVSDPAIDPVTLSENPEFREIAARLPRLQEDLLALQQERRRRSVEEP